MKIRNIAGKLAMAIVVSCWALSAAGQSTNPVPPTVNESALKRAGIKPIGDWQVDPVETQELSQMFGSATQAANSVTPGPDWGFKRHAVDNALRQQLEDFLLDHPNSAYAPNIHVYLAHVAKLRCGYSLAIDHYRKAVSEVTGSPDPTARAIVLTAGGELAKLLALTGQLEELDTLVASVAAPGKKTVPGAQWGWAQEMRTFALKHPTESYKCGLYCLDMLGRMTQVGQFFPSNINETASSPNGFTAADLLNVAARAGLRVHCAVFTDTNSIPVPCVMHLRSDHFVYVREHRGYFYEIVDPVAYGSRWLTVDEIVAEATGCVLVSDVVAPEASSTLVPVDAATAATFRGRCHSPIPLDHDDLGCGGGEGGDSGDPKGHGSTGSSPSPTGSAGGPIGKPTAGCSCGGMPSWLVSEPYLNLWIKDMPLEYKGTYGLPLRLELAHVDRAQGSVVAGYNWHGGEFGNFEGIASLWTCSLMSFAELSSDGSTVDLMVPGKNWVTFTFPTNSGASSISYRTDMWLEQKGPGPIGSVTNLVLHYLDGSTANYGVYDKSDTFYAGLFYMTTMAGPDGVQTRYTYDPSTFYLTNVTAADGTTFSLLYTNYFYPSAVTAVTTSYGAAASFQYVGLYGPVLTSITDAEGLTSTFGYDSPDYGDAVDFLVTPYGTTQFSVFAPDSNPGVFDRLIQITNATGTQEFYGQMNTYSGSSWPDYSASQIPTNTPVGTLDKDSGSRQERNTFYWNAQQFAPLIGKSFTNFDWVDFKKSRIRHWLANTNEAYTHWDTLSLEQMPSPDGGTTEGQITWYDYVGKLAGVDYEIGTQIRPAVVARVMPDGSTWCQYSQRLPNGAATNVIEAWIESGTAHSRNNRYVYSADGIDLLAWTNALGVRATYNMYNSLHQVVTNYDALGQITTNGYDSTTHQITSTLSPSGLVTLYSYNGSRQLQTKIDLPVNRTNGYTWNADGTMATHTDPRGMVESYFWDDLHRLTGTSDSRGSTTNLYYILSGTPYPNSSGGTAILDRTAHRDRLGHWTSYVYDAQRRKVIETNANGTITGYSYCSCGAVSSITNAWNTAVQQVTTYNFDTQSRLSTTLYADGYSVTNWYDSLGRLIVTGDGTANHWLFYNNLGMLTVRSNAYGPEINQTYDVLDRPVYITDANGVTTTNIYDNLNRILSRGYPDGGVERFGYSSKGLVAYTNQLNMVSRFAYDELGRKFSETNANGEILKFTNNAAGDLLQLTDGKSQVTKWNYDQFGRVTNKADQANTVILKYFYDAEDRLTNRWSVQMGTTYYTNDAVGNLTFIKYPFGTGVNMQYDALNRLTNMVDASGTTKYTYTAGNQLWTEVQPFSSSTVTNTYSNRLRVGMALQQPTGLWTNRFIYDLAGRLTNVTSPAGAFAYSVGAASPGSGLIKKIGLPNTAYITNTFDNVARLTGTYLDNSANAVLDSAIYGYNAGNQRTAFTNAAATYVHYSYDNIGQLKTAISSATTENRGYSYDAAWNLQWQTNGASLLTYSVDNKNELTNANGIILRYDGNGNRITNNNDLVYTYDAENRLTQITDSVFKNFQTAFVYDGLSRLRQRNEFTWNGSKWSVAATTTYLYDGNRVIQERDGSNNPLVSYTRGTDLSGSLEGAGGIGGLLARSSGYSAGNWSAHHFYHADGNGNIMYLVDSSQAMAATYHYDPYGNLLSSAGTMAGTNMYRFSSEEFLANGGMYIYLRRFYDPWSQRWLNRDPSGESGGINLYGFTYNHPVDYVDRDGLDVTAPAPVQPKPAPPRPPAPAPDPKPPTGPSPAPRPPMPPALPPRLPIGGPGLGILCLIFTPTSTGPEPVMGPNGWLFPPNWPTTTCYLSPNSPAGVCLYVCIHTGNPDQNQYIRRAPGPNGCPDTINVRNPYK